MVYIRFDIDNIIMHCVQDVQLFVEEIERNSVTNLQSEKPPPPPPEVQLSPPKIPLPPPQPGFKLPHHVSILLDKHRLFYK
jgi:hypothetical protein